jgi:hypothetical protein
MKMNRTILPTALLTAFAFTAMISAASAGAPIKGLTCKPPYCPVPKSKVGVSVEAPGVVVTLALSQNGGKSQTVTSYAWGPKGDTLNQVPTPAENVNPTSGIGVVVKKNPGSSAARTVPLDGDGIGDLTPDLDGDGVYDIIVTVAANAINSKGTGANRMASSSASMAAPATSGMPKHAVDLVFTLQVTHGQVVVIKAITKQRTKSNQANE